MKTPVLLLSALAALLPSGPALALDPGKAITQYVFEAWETDQGLPINKVFAILQTRDGYLWLGTGYCGLVRFDGVRFTVFDTGNTPELKENSIGSLCEDREGNLWIGTAVGLTRLRGGRFTTFTTKDGLADDDVGSLHEGRDGSLWIGTGKGLSRLRDGKFTNFTTKDGLPDDGIGMLHEGRDGSLWIGTGKGLGRLRDGKFTNFTTKDGLPEGFVNGIHEDRRGTLWIGTSKGLVRLEEGRFTLLTTKEGLPDDRVNGIREDRDGNLWIATVKGLARFRDGMFSTFTKKDGLSDDTLFRLYEDREGSLWFGSNDGGLGRLRDGKFTPFTTKEGLSSGVPWGVHEDREGGLWINVQSGLNRLKDGKVEVFAAKDVLPDAALLAINADRDGNLWVGTDRGLVRLREGRFTRFTKKDGLPNDRVQSFHEDREGSLWIGTGGGGLARLRDGRFTTFGEREGLSQLSVTAIHEDREGSLWIGTGAAGSLVRFRDGGFTTFTAEQGFAGGLVSWFHEDGRGSLWIGSRNGLTRLRDGRFTKVTKKDGLFWDFTFKGLEDGLGNLWMSSNKGIFRVGMKELDAFADGKIARVSSVSYGTADGMRSPEGCAGSPAGWKSRDGRLWFTTVKGMVVVDPAHLPVNRLPPPVVLEEVFVDGKLLDRPSPTRIVVPPGAGTLEIHYTASSLVVPSRVRFRYLLEGFDREWIDAGAQRAARYTNVPPGSYTFRVVACNDDGVWNEKGASLALTLLPRFWQTWGFYGLEGLAALALFSGVLALQRRRLARRADHERVTEEMEHARRVQVGLLPKGALTVGAFAVAGGMQTATEVGGDYYGYLEAGGRLCVVVGDATGHGMASGLVAGMLKAVVASLSRKSGRTDGPAVWLEGLNAALRASISQRGLGVCVGIGLVDVESGDVELGMAGIPHPIHVSAAGAVERIPLAGTPLGYLKRIVTATATRALAPGDRLVLITDGLIEQVNGAGDEWGYAGVEAALAAACAGEAGPGEIAERLLAACEAFGQGQPRTDDRTVVVLARRSAAAGGDA